MGFHLQPIIRTLPYIIKDTTDYLCKLRQLGDIPENAILCSVDVVGLYPHISHGERLNCMKEIIEEFVRNSELAKMDVGTNDLVELARFI